jgi:hypothetical protein
MMTWRVGLNSGRRVNSSFQEDSPFLIRFFDVHFKRSCLQPEKLLMLAVLEDAVMYIEKSGSPPKGQGSRQLRETIEWIAMDDNDWLFSFNNICDALGFDATSLRLALIDMVAKREAA